MSYNDILRNKITQIITNDLTIGRKDYSLTPFTNNEISKFIEDNNDKIEIAIKMMIEEYSNDNEIELLQNPLTDWIREYLYDYVDIVNHIIK